MQLIQFSLGNNVHPLGIISFLSNFHKIGFRKESHFLHSRSNFISPIQTKPPLVTSSKFSLSREHEPSIQPLIGWDNQDINTEFPLLEVDSFESPDPPEKNNFNSSESVKNIIPEIMPTRIDKNISNDALLQINIKSKSKSKKTNKSQKAAEKKAKTKSNPKKTVQLSTPKNINQFIDESKITINSNAGSLLISDESESVGANSEIPTQQVDITSDNNTTIQPFSVNSITPSITASASATIEDKSTLFSNFANDELQLKSDLPSTLPSAESFIAESILQSKENIELDKDTSKLIDDSSIDFSLLSNIEETFTPYISSINNERQVIPEVSESVNLLDISVSPVPSKQNIKPYQSASIDDNKNTNIETDLIQAKEASLNLNSPSLSKESPHNGNYDGNTAIEPNLILENTSNNFLTDNAVAVNSLENLALSSEFISPFIDNTPHSLVNNENPVETHKYTSKAYVALPNPESSITKIPITVQQEIDSSVTSEPLASAPVQLTPNATDIEDTPSLFTNSDNNEQLVTSESQSDMAVNVSDVSAKVTSLEYNSNVNNTTNESTENQSILALPEIGKAPTINATLSEIGEAPTINATLSEIGEAPVVSATLPEIGETGISNDKPLDFYAPLPAISPEIVEAPVINATLPEIGETGISNDKPLDFYAPLPAISPEIGEAPVVNATLPEIGETGISNDKPLGIYAPLPAISPEIGEAPVVNTTSPTSIFRKSIDNEQTVESEFPSAVTNSEVSTKVDNSDKLTSPQNEVSTTPEVEQNTTIENLPAPKGYATGGHVTDSHVEHGKHIAPSDTVPAMLTPGEFVINTRDAQKNLPLLHHLNTGGTPQDIILPSLQIPNSTEPKEKTSPETPTKVDSFPDTSSQLKSNETHSPQISNSLIPSSLGLDIGKQKLSMLNSPQLNPLQKETIYTGEASPQYSSPPLIFRKANPTTHTSSEWSNTPSQWSSVEDLLNANNDESTSFNFNHGKSNSQRHEFPRVSESPQTFAKYLPSPRGFADGGEVTPPDISTKIEPITETIESASSPSEEEDKDDTANLEALAREIYNRLRQRIEIERERHGGYSGRLPW